MQIHRQGDDGHVQLVGAQLLQQHGGEILLDHQRHAGRAGAQLRDQRRQQGGPDGIDGAQTQRAGQFVLTLARQVLHAPRLGQHAPGLGDDALAHRRGPRLAADAFEQADAQLLFQLL